MIGIIPALEHGRSVHLVQTEVDTHAVDTVDDLRLVETLMAKELTGIGAPDSEVPTTVRVSGRMKIAQHFECWERVALTSHSPPGRTTERPSIQSVEAYSFSRPFHGL